MNKPVAAGTSSARRVSEEVPADTASWAKNASFIMATSPGSNPRCKCSLSSDSKAALKAVRLASVTVRGRVGV